MNKSRYKLIGCSPYYCEGMPTPKLLIQLVKSELIFDIKNRAYRFARGLKGDKIDDDLKADIMDICEKENMDDTARILDEVISDVRSMLLKFTKNNVPSGASRFVSNEWEEAPGNPNNDEDYYFALKVPNSFTVDVADSLLSYLHQYVVNKVIANYLLLLYPDGSSIFTALWQSEEEKIKNTINHFVTGRVRRNLHPF